MARTNGKSEMEPPAIDTEHELPESTDTGEDAQARIEAPRAEMAGEQAEIQKLKAERDALLDRIARMQADFENARKRAARELQDYREYALADAIRDLLPVLDSFERALKSSSSERDLRGGIELISKQLEDALTKLGLRPIPAKGATFDPRYHEAIEMVETTAAPDHQIVEELQRGYKLKDRLLRPAMVKVARNSRS
ncbi:MAG TPA: nucleotide exchange factor GrpE [Terriglobales bacterium]|nr:nucleotide exchange factor GrpE [Terriglobales bacterium]